MAMLCHFIVHGGQIGVTFVRDAGIDYELMQTVGITYNFRFVLIESGTVQQLSARNPHINFKNPRQINKLLNF